MEHLVFIPLRRVLRGLTKIDAILVDSYISFSHLSFSNDNFVSFVFLVFLEYLNTESKIIIMLKVQHIIFFPLV